MMVMMGVPSFAEGHIIAGGRHLEALSRKPFLSIAIMANWKLGIHYQ
jgi:hypothetical protein